MNKLPLYKQINKEKFKEGWRIDFVIYKNQPLILDHLVKDRLIVSGAYWFACIRALLKDHSSQNYQIEDLVWLAPFEVKDEIASLTLLIHSEQVILQASGLDLVHARIKSVENITHKSRTLSIPQILAQSAVAIEGGDFYHKLKALGFAYGPSYRVIHHLSATKTWSLAQIIGEDFQQEGDNSPNLVDAAFQACLGIAYASQSTDSAHLPFSLKAIKFYDSLKTTGYIYILLNPQKSKGAAYHLFFLDKQGKVLALMQDFVGRRPLHVRT